MQNTFESGYTKALLDVRNYFEQHMMDLSASKLFNKKGVLKVLDALIYNRAELRETGDTLLIYNEKEKKFVRKDK